MSVGRRSTEKRTRRGCLLNQFHWGPTVPAQQNSKRRRSSLLFPSTIEIKGFISSRRRTNIKLKRSKPKLRSTNTRWVEMVFLCWARPTPQEQKDCVSKSGDFNYDSKFMRATAKPVSNLKEDDELSKAGFLLNHARVLVGSGFDSYEKGKSALQKWRHFGFDWTFVDPKTPIENGVKFCVCVKEFLPWIMMPLQVVYVEESRNSKKGMASFCFGSGTLQGHLLAGEERFSIEMDENNQVWYEILSFSKPAHFLSVIGYPYVQLKQKFFAHQSTNAVLKHVNAS